jgi:hypothetical protein
MGKISKIGLSFFCFGIFSGLTSCQPVRSTRNSFQDTQYCFDGQPTGLDTKINTKGYYSFTETYTKTAEPITGQKVSSYQVNCLFLEDGVFIYYFNPEALDGYWGRYAVHNDTIKAQYIEPPRGMSWSKTEISFQIIDRNTIQQLNVQTPVAISQKDSKQNQPSGGRRTISLGKFIIQKNLPNSDKSWLKKREWFWCDKDQYKAWKKNSMR